MKGLIFLLAVSAYAQVGGWVVPAKGGSSGNATTVNGAAVPASAACLGSNSSRQLITGTCGSGTDYTNPDGTVTIDNTAHTIVLPSIIARTDNGSVFTSLPTFNVGIGFAEDASCATNTTAGCIFIDPATHAPAYTDNAGAAHPIGGFSQTWIKATQSTGQVIADSTDTDLTFNTNDSHNTGSGITHSTSSNTERFVAAVAGPYSGACQFKSADTTSGGFFEVRIFHNAGGVDTEVGIGANVITSIAFTTNQASFSEYMAVGDYIHCSTTHNGGFTMTTEAPTSFWIHN